MKRIKPLTLLLLSLTLTTLLLASCNINEPREGFFGTFGEVRAINSIEDYDQFVSLLLRVSYANNAELVGAFHILTTNRQLTAASRGEAPHIHTDIVFVRSFEEILDHPEGVLVLWPGEMSRGLLLWMNRLIATYGIDLEQFSLSYPLTMDNIVYDWEGFDGFLLRVSRNPYWFLDRHEFSRLSIEAIAEEKAQRNLSPQDEELWQQLFFALSMSFQHNVEGMRIMDMKRALENGEHNFTGIAVVHSSDEAAGYPDDIVVFWPSELTELGLRHINGFIFNVTTLNLEDFSLVYPVTIESLVNNWENTSLFWRELNPWTRDSLQRSVASQLQDLKISQMEYFRELGDDE